MSEELRRIAVIDGNSLMHRAFHAVPDYMMTPDGRHTNAVFGFISMLIKMVEDFSPDGIICAFDAGIPDFRMKAVEVYKAQRPPTDPALKEQFPLIEGLLEAMDIPVVKVTGFEGDDVLGTLSRMGEEAGIETYIVSGDRDIFQLATDRTKIVATRVGMSDVKVYGPEEVLERYGIGPELVPDFIALKGDSSDNIPGVPGIGEKTAAKLLVKYGTAQGIIDHAGEIKGKAGTNIAENIDAIEAGRLVATIVRDLDIDIDFDKVVFPSFDPTRVIEAFKELGITSHVSKILAFEDGSTPGPREEEAAEPLEIFAGDDAASALERAVASGGPVAVLIEDGAEGMLFGSGKAVAACCGTEVALFHDADVASVVARALGAACLVLVDSKEVLSELVPADSSIEAAVELADIDFSRVFDLSIAAYLLNSSKSSYSLENMAFDHLSVQLPERAKPARGAEPEALSDDDVALRVRSMLRLHELLSSRLDEDGSRRCYDEIEMPLVPVLMAMERAGLDLDIPRVHELSAGIGGEIDALKAQVFELAGEEFNIASPKQLGEVLFEKLGLPARKKTRSGYSTDASVLTELSEKHPLPGLVLEFRELTKIKNTYLDTLPGLVRGDGRLHTSFNQTITATGRLSSSDPNLQNIPVRTELGRQIRTAFGPYREMAAREGGAVFLSADYSQIELRLLAELSGDEGLIDAFNQGSDFHRSTAAGIFGIAPEDVTPELRSHAKAVNFGIVYGQQAYGLSQSLRIPMYEAQGMIDRYFAAYPKVKEYLEGLVAHAHAYQWVETMFGRKRHIPEIASSNANQRAAGERVAMNHPMQGSAADIIKLAMIAVERRLAEEGFEAVMMLQVHDELDFSCPSDEVGRLSEMVVDAMSHVVDLRVPLDVSVAYGPTWADAK